MTVTPPRFGELAWSTQIIRTCKTGAGTFPSARSKLLDVQVESLSRSPLLINHNFASRLAAAISSKHHAAAAAAVEADLLRAERIASVRYDPPSSSSPANFSSLRRPRHATPRHATRVLANLGLASSEDGEEERNSSRIDRRLMRPACSSSAA